MAKNTVLYQKVMLLMDPVACLPKSQILLPLNDAHSMELNLNKHFAALKKYCARFQQLLIQIDTKCCFEKGSFVTR